MRAAAGAIDLIPGVLLTMFLYRTNVPEILMSWPGYARPGELESLFPGMTVIVVYVVHTFVGEFKSGQTIGKRLMKIRVVNLDGTPATKTQIIHRNLRKLLDMVAFPFLILPVISPFRQRLGDMIAKTLVVVIPDEEGTKPTDSSDDTNWDNDENGD